MIHELRVFHCVPGRLPALLKRFETDTLRLLKEAWNQAARILDCSDRRVQQRFVLDSAMGIFG
jgi:hypothetical protein